MVRKYPILSGIIISAALLLVVAGYYPADSPNDNNPIPYDWKTNPGPNHFSNKAINGTDNPSGLLPIGGMFFLFSP